MEDIRDVHEETQDQAENEDWEDDEEYSDDGLDAEAEAEAIARRLQEQLWADIAKAQADAAAASATAAIQTTAVSPAEAPVLPATGSLPSRKQEAALLTMKTIIQYANKDPLFRSTLASTNVPEKGDVFSLLTRSITDGAVAKGLAKPLAELMIALARSESLFLSIKNSDASVIELEKGKHKRKREVEAEINAFPPQKRPFLTPDCEYLHTQVQDAVRIVTDALRKSMPATPSPVDSSLIASIQIQLHQVFLFAVTSSAGSEGHHAHVLQEVGGLIQVLGVLSGIQIGQQPQPDVAPLSGTAMPPDIGTAVYRCLMPSCHKTFIRLYSLRAHQRLHTQGDRPFQCTACAATFARNHDLKRHAKLHDSMAYKCLGCDKLFSRRDAIKRHKTSARGKGKNTACIDADVEDVDLGDTKTPRMYTYPTSSIAQSGQDLAGVFEEGQVGGDIVGELQAMVLRLHPLLQEYVTNALGAQSGQEQQQPIDVARGQGQNTLASVIARAQQQSSSADISVPVGSQSQVNVAADMNVNASDAASLAMYGLSDEQARLLEEAVANAASLAQAQAEAEAALEEEDDEYGSEEEG